MTSRFPFRLPSLLRPLPFCLALCLGLLGCTDAQNAGRLAYNDSDRLATDLKGKPDLQKAVKKALADLFGPDPQHIKMPAGSGFASGGIRLANYREVELGKVQRIKVQYFVGGDRVVEAQEGGFGLYRKHCLHCHGVSGAGDGPTAAFLYPRPRDYRKGIFKFTSTATGAKPTRADLRKTIRYGLHGTSMPAFEALLNENGIEQVLDYMIFLTQRGETEDLLIGEAVATGELSSDSINDTVKLVYSRWQQAESQVLNPPIPRTPASPESIKRGRDMFLVKNTTGPKLECAGCHGPQGMGNGPSFVAQDVFNDVVFGGNPSELADRLEKYDAKTKDLWKNSLDEWGNPLRPANLNRGIYKGGRRPIDIYWRIAKGINGAKMPAHYPGLLNPEQIWDLVNFVLAIPLDPSLLEGATAPAITPAAAAPKVANR